jgi:pSer/pThr/pTyr-binding forkhead associated (FHA) protein
MTAQVTLLVTRGEFIGEEFVFTGRTQCVLGRASDCSLRLAGDDLSVSRHHRRLDIDAPEAWVEDLDSLNGTFVNGESIGRRGQPGEGVPPAKTPPRRLTDGDELRIGGNVLEVIIDGMAWVDGEAKGRRCMAGA